MLTDDILLSVRPLIVLLGSIPIEGLVFSVVAEIVVSLLINVSIVV
jgi:hypothetical protein